MAKNKKEAKFFCENCGSEVPENAKMCKKCGKFFISVRCPKCGYNGTTKEFKLGCPECGYAMGKSKQNFAGASTVEKAKALNSIFSSAGSTKVQGKQSESLPIWVYAVTFSVLIAVMFGVYGCIR